MPHKSPILACAVALVAASSCIPEPSLDETVGHFEQPAYVLANSVWDSTDIAVCWENPSDANAEGRNWTRDAVEETWMAHSRLHFYGWGPCSGEQRGIRIVIEDGHPHVQRLGNALDGMESGMLLNFTFENWSPGCKDERKRCIRAIAVHEFGHAIGFAHEQDRPDTPESCNDVLEDGGDAVIGPWDEDSVMNYCNEEWIDGELSHFDKVAVALTYGTSELRGLSLRNVMANNCLDVEHVSTADGANLHSWECHGGLNQMWDLVPGNGGGYRIVSRRSFKCLDIAEVSTHDGANAHQWTCHDGDNQRFTLQPRNGGYQIVAKHSGRCLDVDYGSSKNGTNVLQWGCHGNDNQIWKLVP